MGQLTTILLDNQKIISIALRHQIKWNRKLLTINGAAKILV